MTGLNRQTGRALDDSDNAHLRQSIADILTTPKGSRVMRREYGSDLPDLIDQPLNGATRLRIFAATAMAVLRWERRVRLRRVRLEASGPDGAARLSLELVRIDRPRRQALTLDFTLPAFSPMAPPAWS